MSLTDLSEKYLDVAKKHYGTEDVNSDQINEVRLSLGMSLSAVHSSLLMSAKTDEQKDEMMRICLDTITRLMESLKDTADEIGIKMEIGSGRIVEDNGQSVFVDDKELN